METWNVRLSNSDTLKIKAKKKELLKTEKNFLSATLIENDQTKEILINRNFIAWLSKEEKTKEDN